ncbi:hypothetical protein PABY_09210 [Pyrodictium abyssi]|uniref:Ribbon-helix-helix protein CopG domain-containing protein n=2 Tax=Pyrodictium abyssi TaxID=54256 RepID=A0ABM8IWZ1_9CREN|nr:hypothetical protein PABY_09210 [Pyrodictium abyssi]
MYGAAKMTSRQRVYDTGNVFDVPVSPPKKVVSVKLEVDIIEEMDRIWRSLGYASRSEFIREAILYYMQVVMSSQAVAKTPVMGIVPKEGELTETALEDDMEDV